MMDRFQRLTILCVMLAMGTSSCARRGEDRTISASGTIEATEVRVAAKTAGQVLAMNVEEGSRIETGDPLAVVDTSDLVLQRKQAEAAVELARAQLALLEKGPRAEDLRQAEENLKQMEAAVRSAEADKGRVEALYAQGSATEKQRDDTRTRYAVSMAQYRAAQAALDRLRKGAREEELRVARAGLEQARAGLAVIVKKIEDCTVRAPTKGIVTRRLMEAGELVSPGTPLVILSDLSQVHLTIYVTVTELGRVALGQRAEVTVDAFPGRIFPGKVTHIAQEAEFTPKNVQTKEDRVKLVFGVKIELDNPDGALKPGMPADATIKVRLEA